MSKWQKPELQVLEVEQTKYQPSGAGSNPYGRGQGSGDSRGGRCSGLDS